MSTQCPQSFYERAYWSLTRGVRELDIQGSSVPCELALTGDDAFPLAINSKGQVLMAASLYGRGRIVVLGHESYLQTLPSLVENAVTWLRGDSDNMSVGVYTYVQAVAENLSKSSFETKVVGSFSSSLGLGVYVTDAYSVDPYVKDLVAFLKSGGGVLIGGQAWHWASTHQKESTLLQFPGNKVSGVAGIYFSALYGKVENMPVCSDTPSSLFASPPFGTELKDDLEVLLKEVSNFYLPDDLSASDVLVHGPLAFPIGTTEDGQAFLAGNYYGKGRVIVVTHEALLQNKTMETFWKNAIGWLDQGRNGVVGVVPRIKLNLSGLKCERTNFREGLSVFVCTAYSDDHVEEIQDFVAEGGGLLIGGHAWYWAQTHFQQNPLTDFAGNRILNKMGLTVLKTMIANGTYKAPVPTKESRHLRYLLRCFADHVLRGEKLTAHVKENLKNLGKECANFLNVRVYDSYSYTQVRSVLTEVLKKSGMPQVSEGKPVKNPKDHLLLSVGAELYNVSPHREALLPYLIKEDPTMHFVHDQTIAINADTADGSEWLSTGLYLPPGIETEIILPEEIINKKWVVQVGSHTDYLRDEEVQRAPSVDEQFLVTTEKMHVWNLWGGLIYLVAPPNTKLEAKEIIVQKAVLAPYYKSGGTSAAVWSQRCKAPAPWAELEFDNIVLTVPSHVVRKLERPDEVAAVWNDIMKGVADLAVIPRKFARKERIVADVQISAGFMHSGYPVMIHLSSAAEMVHPGQIKTKGIWGQIHELGHNQQRQYWEFRPHTTEATCNLWSVYVHEEVLGVNRAKAHPSMTPESRRKNVKDYVKGGKNLRDWNVWVTLETYLQLQEKFGWDAIKKVFAAYHQMSNFPNDNTGKMNLYAETFSRAVGMNLTGFFKAWGWPIGRDTEEKVCSLPPWTDHPMVPYN